MRKNNAFTALTLAAALGLGMAACTVEQTEEGNLPEYEVEQTEEGNLPEYDVDAAEVEVGTEEKTITVPTVEVNPPDDESDEEDPDEEPPAS
jgi:hypothetical protein